ncbi:MAG: nucleoside hydrolase [Kiloniellales bacterium]|nr:nucleoside hydrolase [Kiloniellales bacterium]
MERTPIILDCDPGIDDAIAILLALSCPDEIRLIGITTCAGNVGLEQTTRNAGRILTLGGKGNIPVYPGCSRALLSPIAREPEVHGKDGLGGAEFPDAVPLTTSKHGVDFLTEAIMDNPPDSLTLCATGPLTNLGLAFVKEPRLPERLRKLVLMGGAVRVPGNMGETATAEFNIHSDPHAAEIVFTSKLKKIVLMSLDVTRQAVVDGTRLEALKAAGNRSSKAAASMLENYGRSKKCLHDPLVIAYLLQPDLFSGPEERIQVDHQYGRDYGRTSISSDRARPPVVVMERLDADGFFKLLSGQLAKLP